MSEIPTPLPPSTAFRTAGLDIPAVTDPTKIGDRSIRWLRASDGAVVADVFGYEIANIDGIDVEAHGLGTNASQVRLSALVEGGPGDEAQFWIRDDPAPASSKRTVYASLLSDGGGSYVSRTLIDSAKRSSFPQLYAGGNPAFAEARTNYGTGVITWPGGKSKSSTTTIAHGLGRAPTIVLATMIGTGGDGAVFATMVLNVGATNFDVIAEDVSGAAPALGFQRTVQWLAIG